MFQTTTTNYLCRKCTQIRDRKWYILQKDNNYLSQTGTFITYNFDFECKWERKENQYMREREK